MAQGDAAEELERAGVPVLSSERVEAIARVLAELEPELERLLDRYGPLDPSATRMAQGPAKELARAEEAQRVVSEKVEAHLERHGITLEEAIEAQRVLESRRGLVGGAIGLAVIGGLAGF